MCQVKTDLARTAAARTAKNQVCALMFFPTKTAGRRWHARRSAVGALRLQAFFCVHCRTMSATWPSSPRSRRQRSTGSRSMRASSLPGNLLELTETSCRHWNFPETTEAHWNVPKMALVLAGCTQGHGRQVGPEDPRRDGPWRGGHAQRGAGTLLHVACSL